MSEAHYRKAMSEALQQPDPEALALGLFNGPIWDDAQTVYWNYYKESENG